MPPRNCIKPLFPTNAFVLHNARPSPTMSLIVGQIDSLPVFLLGGRLQRGVNGFMGVLDRCVLRRRTEGVSSGVRVGRSAGEGIRGVSGGIESERIARLLGCWTGEDISPERVAHWHSGRMQLPRVARTRHLSRRDPSSPRCSPECRRCSTLRGWRGIAGPHGSGRLERAEQPGRRWRRCRRTGSSASSPFQWMSLTSWPAARS